MKIRRGQITVDQVMALRPCKKYTRSVVAGLWAGRSYITYSGVRGLSVPDSDKLWLLIRIMTERQKHIFGCDCAERVLPIANDDRCDRVIEVKRRWIDGQAANLEFWASAGPAAFVARDAGAAAGNVALAARDAVWDAVWDAGAAAGNVALAARAARDAAALDARDAALAAGAAAWDARDAVWDARDARAAALDAGAAAGNAEYEWQVNRAIELLEAG